MFGVTTSDDYRPVAWMGRYPVDVTTILVAVHSIAAVFACFIPGLASALMFDSSAALNGAVWQIGTYAFAHPPSMLLQIALDRRARPDERLDGAQHRDDLTLRVARAEPPHAAVADLAAERVRGPAVADRHRVQMRVEGDDGPARATPEPGDDVRPPRCRVGRLHLEPEVAAARGHITGDRVSPSPGFWLGSRIRSTSCWTRGGGALVVIPSPCQ